MENLKFITTCFWIGAGILSVGCFISGLIYGNMLVVRISLLTSILSILTIIPLLDKNAK